MNKIPERKRVITEPSFLKEINHRQTKHAKISNLMELSELQVSLANRGGYVPEKFRAAVTMADNLGLNLPSFLQFAGLP